MGVTNSWRSPVTMADWMRDIEKRLMHEERRPIPAPAYDVVGPGFRAYANLVTDWNSDGPIVGGHFYSVADQVVSSPDDTRNWMGIVQSNAFGEGLQRVWEYIDTADAPNPDPVVYTRAFVTNEDGTRTYTDWLPGGGGGGTGGPTGPAGGDLTGTYPNPQIAAGAITGTDIASGVIAYTFVQGTAASVWVIDHPLSFRPNVAVVDSAGRQVEGDVTYTDADTVTLTFTSAFAGTAYLS